MSFQTEKHAHNKRMTLNYRPSAKKFKSPLIIILLISFYSTNLWAQDHGCPKIIKPQNITYYKDKNGELDFEKIEKLTFNKIGKSNFGFSDSTIWAKVPFNPPTSCNSGENWRLQIRPPYTDHISIYWRDQDNKIQTHFLGDRVGDRETSYRIPNIEIPENLLSDKKNIYLKIKGNNALAIEAELVGESYHQKQEIRALVIAGSSISLILILCLLSAVNYVALKNIGYIFFILFNINILAIGCLVYGISNLLFPPFWGDALATTAQALNLSIIIVISRHILNIEKYYPAIYNIFKIFAFTLSGWGVLTVAIDKINLSLPWIHLASGLALIAITIFSVVLWKKEPQAKIFFFLSMLLMLGYIIQVSALNGQIEKNFFTDNAPGLMLLVDVLLIFLALNHQAAKERLEAQQLRTKSSEAAAEVKRRRLFARLLSHELRTPLAVVAASNRNIQEEADQLSPFLQSSLSRQRNAVQRLQQITDLCLTEDRIRDIEEITVLPPESLWGKLKERALEQATSKARLVLFDESKTNLTGVVSVNIHQFLVAFELILDNAFKYSPESSEIFIKVGRLKSHVTVSISNQGAGFSEDAMRPKAFQRGSNTQDIPGLGLGLAISQEIIEKSGGYIKIENFSAQDDIDRVAGCSVTLSLPIL